MRSTARRACTLWCGKKWNKRKHLERTLSQLAKVATAPIFKKYGRSFQVMAQTGVDKIPPGPELDALTAEKVFGWRNVHQHNDRGGLYGKRQDKAGHWRFAKVLNYSTNPAHAYSIDEHGRTRAARSIREETLQDHS